MKFIGRRVDAEGRVDLVHEGIVVLATVDKIEEWFEASTAHGQVVDIDSVLGIERHGHD